MIYIRIQIHFPPLPMTSRQSQPYCSFSRPENGPLQHYHGHLSMLTRSGGDDSTITNPIITIKCSVCRVVHEVKHRGHPPRWKSQSVLIKANFHNKAVDIPLHPGDKFSNGTSHVWNPHTFKVGNLELILGKRLVFGIQISADILIFLTDNMIGHLMQIVSLGELSELS